MPETYINATREAGAALFARGISGPIVMLNLLRFQDVADYSGFHNLAPSAPISGREAYQRYIDHVVPLLEQYGSEIIFMGQGGAYLIGPEGTDWDLVLLVRHASLKRFMAFATDENYLSGAGHREAALADSRLLPIEEHQGTSML